MFGDDEITVVVVGDHLEPSQAAMMTGCLSIVGESVVKRAMASENPCNSLRKLIEEELCPVNQRAAASPMVCPAGA